MHSLAGIPRVAPGDDLAALIARALVRDDVQLEPGDALAITSKLLSRAEDRFVDLGSVTPDDRAREVAHTVGKDARLVHLILQESTAISRLRKGVLIVRHRLGHVCANAGIDASNAQPAHAPANSGPWVLLLPRDPDASAATLRARLTTAGGVAPAIIVTDSLGRPFRHGTVGFALGCAGLAPVHSLRGQPDLDGRPLEHTDVAVADQLAAAADLMAGQRDEGRPVTLMRGLHHLPPPQGPGDGAIALNRAPEEDLYA